MSLEDGMLMMKPEQNLVRDWLDAEERHTTHLARERARRAARLPSDMDRWEKTGVAWD